MKIETLTIRGFKNLEDVTADFSAAGPAVVLVGQNGSGKSNLLEAIAILFRDLALRRKTPFAYDITYQIRSQTVRIENAAAPDQSIKFALKDHGKKGFKSLAADEFFSGQSLMPANIFGYYSGSRTNLPQIFAEHETSFYFDARLGAESRAEFEEDQEELDASAITPLGQIRRFFYGHLKNTPLVLLSYFASGNTGLQSFLKKELAIDGFDSALITLRRPDWLQISPDNAPKGFFPWDIVHALDNEAGALLQALWDTALAPMVVKLDEPDPDDVMEDFETPQRDKIFLFFSDLDRLAEAYRVKDPEDVPNTPQSFFALLEALSVLKILEDAQVWVTRNGVKQEISSKEISDGEKQLLTIVGLLYLTPGEESLFLLDEPDTHLNPAWKWDFLQTIQKEAGDVSRCQFLLTSHDPLTVAGLKREDVLIVYKDRETGQTEIDHPSVDPQGLGVAGVLRQIFGMRTTLDPETQSLIDERNELLTREQRSRDQELQLHQLNHQIQLLGITIQNQQDLFEQFLKLYKRVESQEAALSPEQIIDQNEAMRRAVAELQKDKKLQ